MAYPCRIPILSPLPFVLAIVLAAPAAGGQRPQVGTTIQIAATPLDGSPPTIDGTVDDAGWQGVEPYTNFIQTDPIEGDPASERTEVRVLFDRTTLYISVIAFDSE